jgi:hypothetical protein
VYVRVHAGYSLIFVVVSDIEVAYNTVEAEAKATLQRVRDRRIAQSAQRAVSQDADLIAALTRVEAQERTDRAYALALYQNTTGVSPPQPIQRPNHQSGAVGFGGTASRQQANPASSVVSSLQSALASPPDSPAPISLIRSLSSASAASSVRSSYYE